MRNMEILLAEWGGEVDIGGWARREGRGRTNAAENVQLECRPSVSVDALV
jgi:hypothetical protein